MLFTIVHQRKVLAGIVATLVVTILFSPLSVLISEKITPAGQLNKSLAAGQFVSRASAISKMPEPCTDFFNCRVQDEIVRLHNFLLSRKNAEGYSPDPRYPTLSSENVRLLIDTQAHAYLNFYKHTRNRTYLREAQDRLDYILTLPEEVALGLQPNHFNGMLAYTFFTAYELTRKQEYYNFAYQIAERCLTYPNTIMNWGMMCAMAYGKAYKLTGQQSWQNASRTVTQNTVSHQFANGGFQHRTNDAYVDTHYSIWMAHELLEIRASDPGDPSITSAFIKLANFLKQRVNSDGSINYQDQSGRYYEVQTGPTGHDTMGWSEELVELAMIMRSVGDDARSELLMQYLFSMGDNSLYYPDKWGYFTPGNASMSVVRTSMVFWDLSYLVLVKKRECTNGEAQECTPPVAGQMQYCIQGTLSPCSAQVGSASSQSQAVVSEGERQPACLMAGSQQCLAE